VSAMYSGDTLALVELKGQALHMSIRSEIRF
jgi:hypothetical protein